MFLSLFSYLIQFLVCCLNTVFRMSVDFLPVAIPSDRLNLGTYTENDMSKNIFSSQTTKTLCVQYYVKLQKTLCKLLLKLLPKTLYLTFYNFRIVFFFFQKQVIKYIEVIARKRHWLYPQGCLLTWMCNAQLNCLDYETSVSQKKPSYYRYYLSENKSKPVSLY